MSVDHGDAALEDQDGFTLHLRHHVARNLYHHALNGHAHLVYLDTTAADCERDGLHGGHIDFSQVHFGGLIAHRQLNRLIAHIEFRRLVALIELDRLVTLVEGE